MADRQAFESSFDSVDGLERALKARSPEGVQQMAKLVPTKVWRGSQEQWEKLWLSFLLNGSRRQVIEQLGDHEGRQHFRKEPWEVFNAMKTYNTAVMKDEDFVAAMNAADANIVLDGCGTAGSSSSTYRWTTDGAHIFAGDDKTVPPSRTLLDR